MKEKMKKSLTTPEALSIVVGMIIGSGIFLKPGVILSSAGSPTMALLAWVAGGVITLASALSIAELASAIPVHGGLYGYLEVLYGEIWGFLLGWVQTMITYPASVAAQAIAFASYAGLFLPMSDTGKTALAFSVLLFLLIMNILSTKYGGFIQTAAAVGKLIPLAGISVFGLAHTAKLNFESVGTVTASGFGAAVLGTLWAYDGWIGVTNMAPEMKTPKKLPKVISFGIIFVIIVYTAFNFAVFKVLPLETAASSPVPGVEAANVLFGQKGTAFITAGIMISVFGSLNGYLMTSARVPLAMGEKRMLPFSRVFGRINGRFGTPANALIMQSALALIYILSGSFNALTDILVFVVWIFFTMGVFGVFVMRKKHPELKGSYKVPLYPLTPIVGIAGSLYILISTGISAPKNAVIGLMLTAIGVVVYRWLKKKNMA